MYADASILPFPGPDQVLIKLNATGLCMSDIHFMSADWALPKMSVFGVQCAGHEGAGVIVKLGSNVKNLKGIIRRSSPSLVRERPLVLADTLHSKSRPTRRFQAHR